MWHALLAVLILTAPSDDEGHARVSARTHESAIDVIARRQAPNRESASAGTANPPSQAVASPSVVERRSVIACDGNQLELTAPADVMCTEATAMCASTPQAPQVMVWFYRRTDGGLWQRSGQGCVTLAQATGAAPATPVITAADLQRLPLPAGTVHIQPASGRTLVDVPTNLYVDATPVTIPTTVLGQPVQVRATPTTYTWTYGDGTALTTTDPGAPYPELRTSHTYRSPATVRIGLTTTYRGEYSVNRGPWQPVDGTATVTGVPVPLTIVAAHAELVADPLAT
jgi:hypothetical protein